MDAGELVPDEVIVGMIAKRVREPDASDGFLLDGFPRNAEQADALARGARGTGPAPLGGAPDRGARRRARAAPGGRRVCVKNPSHIYHVDFDPPKHEGVCDQDGSRLMQRDDDKRGDDPPAPGGLPLPDRAADRPTTTRRACCAASTARATPDEVHAHIRATSPRCAWRRSSDAEPSCAARAPLGQAKLPR